MRNHIFARAAIFIVFAATPAAAQVTVIRAGKLVDPETGTVRNEGRSGDKGGTSGK